MKPMINRTIIIHMSTTAINRGSMTIPNTKAITTKNTRQQEPELNHFYLEHIATIIIGPPIASKIGVTIISSSKKKIRHRNNLHPDQSFDLILPGIKPGHPNGLKIAK
jgi:hypothetical protein